MGKDHNSSKKGYLGRVPRRDQNKDPLKDTIKDPLKEPSREPVKEPSKDRLKGGGRCGAAKLFGGRGWHMGRDTIGRGVETRNPGGCMLRPAIRFRFRAYGIAQGSRL